MLDAALCHSHSQYTPVSISIIAAPRGTHRREEGEINSVCVCMRVRLRVRMLLPLDQRTLKRENAPVCFLSVFCAARKDACMPSRVCLCVRVCVCTSRPAAVFSSSNRHPSVCYLSKLKAPVVFWGASGREGNNRAITLLLLSSQRCCALPCLVFLAGGLCCEAWFPFCFSEIFIYPRLGSLFSLPLQRWIKETLILPFVFLFGFSLIFFFLSLILFETAENV